MEPIRSTQSHMRYEVRSVIDGHTIHIYDDGYNSDGRPGVRRAAAERTLARKAIDRKPIYFFVSEEALPTPWSPPKSDKVFEPLDGRVWTSECDERLERFREIREERKADAKGSHAAPPIPVDTVDGPKPKKVKKIQDG